MSNVRTAFATATALQALASLGCLLRGLPLFFRASPRTPLRVLGIIALDTLHVLRHSRPMPRERISELAMFMDFEGCANAAWDHKQLCRPEYADIRRRLEQAGLGWCLDAYLGRLRELETRRPSIGGDRRRFDDVRSYREDVARLSLAAAAAIALTPECRDHGIPVADEDPDVNTLYRILMQCQIIDDVVDYAEDAAAGLPSFLTASASLPMALELTAASIGRYAAVSPSSSARGVFPLRVALAVVTAITKLIVGLACRRHVNAQALGSEDWQIRRVERRPGSR
jgi:hypothetical protein